MKRNIVLLILATLFASSFSVAQAPRFALSTHATSINTRDRIAGFGATFGYSFSRRFAMETTLNGFPGDPRNDLGHAGPPYALGAWRSGNILQAQVGVKANFLQLRRADLFFAAKPGFLTYSRLAYRFAAGIGGPGGDLVADVGRQTYFAPFFGAGAQVYPTSRTFLRLDVGATVIRYAGFTTEFNTPFGLPGTGALIVAPARTTHTLQFSTGFGFRFGSTH